MNETSTTLLQKLRNRNDAVAWRRFVVLYLPLLFYCGRRLPLKGADADDLVQDVLLKLVQKLPVFHYDPDNGVLHRLLQFLPHPRYAENDASAEEWIDERNVVPGSLA